MSDIISHIYYGFEKKNDMSKAQKGVENLK